MLFDNFSLIILMVTLGMYTNLPNQEVQILGTIQILMMIFFLTTFFPGASVERLKAL